MQECRGDGTWGACDTTDGCQCDPAVDTVRTIACGNCGFMDSSCGPDGLWADDAVCQSEGACTPDDVETVPLFDSSLQGFFWDFDNTGLKLAQLRFYEVQ